MSYKLYDDGAKKLLRVVASGEFDFHAARHLLWLAYKHAARLGSSIIFDLRDARTSITEPELYKLAHTHPALTAYARSVPRSAVIPGPAIPKQLVDFYLTEMAAQFIPVKVFRDFDSAQQWVAPSTRSSLRPGPGTGEIPGS